MRHDRLRGDSHSDRPRRLRVFRVIARLNVGGPTRHTVILDRGLRDRGFETLLVHGSVGSSEASLEGLAKSRALPTWQIVELGRQISIWDDVRAFWKIAALMWRWRPDIVHTHTAKAGTLGRLAALLYNLASRRSRRCAVLHTFHGHVFAGYFGRLGSALVRIAERALAHATDRLVVISETQRTDITHRFAIAAADKVVMVPLGLELGALLTRSPDSPGLRGALDFGEDDLVVGYVGRLVAIKDLGTLVGGVALARNRLPHIKLVIAGDGEERQALEQLVRQAGLWDETRFLGWRHDLPELYSTMDMFVLTSLNEGTPVSLIEAMAAGVPVIASAVGGVPDVVQDGITGILVAASQPQAVAGAITRLADDPARSAPMTARARESVARRFDSSRLVEEIDALYHEVIAAKRGGRAPLTNSADRPVV